MNLHNLCKALGLCVICGECDTDFSGVYVGDFLSRAMSRVSEGDVWVTIMANTNVIAVASLTDAACILLAEGVTLMDDALGAAKENGITVLSSDDSAYELCLKIGKFLEEGTK